MNQPKILGVCLWLARRFDLDVMGVRLAFILAAILTVGSGVLAYLFIYLIMPKHNRYI